MTIDRDLKRKIRARMAKTGESYQTARRRLTGDQLHEPTMSADDVGRVLAYFDACEQHVARWRVVGGRWRPFDAEVPVQSMQAAALLHPSPRVRRAALGVLDHAASDESTATFRAALLDPVPRVRMVALHGLSCERCRVGEIEVTAVVSDLLRTLIEDDSPKVRHAAIGVLVRFAGRDRRVVGALAAAAEDDDDEFVRVAANGAARLERKVWSRKAVRRRSRRGTSAP